MSLAVLRHAHHSVVISEAFQETVEPLRDEAAAAPHEVDLAVGDDDTLKHLYLLGKRIGKTGGIDGVVAILELIFHSCARIILNDGTAHGELIEIVVGEMVYDLSHLMLFRAK